MTRRIALMRAKDDAEATAAELAARGCEGVIAPAIEIRALPAALPQGRFDALVATSPRAIHALGEADRARLAAIPLYVVGARAARAARDTGLALAGDPTDDAAALAERLARKLPRGARLLYLAGRDRKPTLERRSPPPASSSRRSSSTPPRRARRGARAKRRRSPIVTARCTIRVAPPRMRSLWRRGRGSPNASARCSTSASRPTSPNRSSPTARRKSSAPTRPTRRISWRRSSARSSLRPKAEAGATVRDAAPVSNPRRLAYKVARSDSEGPWPRIRSRAPNRRSARRRRPRCRVPLGPIRDDRWRGD